MFIKNKVVYYFVLKYIAHNKLSSLDLYIFLLNSIYLRSLLEYLLGFFKHLGL